MAEARDQGMVGQEKRQVWAGLRGPRGGKRGQRLGQDAMTAPPCSGVLAHLTGKAHLPADSRVPTGQMDKILGLGSCNRNFHLHRGLECWLLV